MLGGPACQGTARSCALLADTVTLLITSRTRGRPAFVQMAASSLVLPHPFDESAARHRLRCGRVHRRHFAVFRAMRSHPRAKMLRWQSQTRKQTRTYQPCLGLGLEYAHFYGP
jgi:hypothetical protein